MYHIGVDPKDLYCVGHADEYDSNPLTAARAFWARMLDQDPDHPPTELLCVRALTPPPLSDSLAVDIPDEDVVAVWTFACNTGWAEQDPIVRTIPTNAIYQELYQ